MIKATMTAADGREILLLALSHANLDKLRTHGLKGYIKVDGSEIGWPGREIMVTAGETEASMVDALQEFIGSNTKVHISEKLKS